MNKGSYTRTNRITYLRNFYVNHSCDYELTYQRAKKMGVSDSTAKDYLNTLITQLQNKYNI